MFAVQLKQLNIMGWSGRFHFFTFDYLNCSLDRNRRVDKVKTSAVFLTAKPSFQMSFLSRPFLQPTTFIRGNDFVPPNYFNGQVSCWHSNSSLICAKALYTKNERMSSLIRWLSRFGTDVDIPVNGIMDTFIHEEQSNCALVLLSMASVEVITPFSKVPNWKTNAVEGFQLLERRQHQLSTKKREHLQNIQT